MSAVPTTLRPPVAAVISVLEPGRDRQGHWLLPCGGYPQAMAALLGEPLCSTGQPARTWREWVAVLAPLPPLSTSQGHPGQPAPFYRYLICLPPGRRELPRVSCWRRYPEGVGWQRRCGPMPLAVFVQRFSVGAQAAGAEVTISS
ncbi:MAG: hypothetical protein ACKO6F_08735 [Cyanobium sp.]